MEAARDSLLTPSACLPPLPCHLPPATTACLPACHCLPAATALPACPFSLLYLPPLPHCLPAVPMCSTYLPACLPATTCPALI